MTSSKFSNFKPTDAIKLTALENTLKAAGFKEPQLNFALASLLHETGIFSKKQSLTEKNNNYSGIKWINASRQKNATKGQPVPPSERDTINPNNPLNYYAKFASIQDWANDYKRITSTFGFKPILATSPEDWAHRLKLNSYFGGSESVYLSAIKKFLAMFK